ncbi:MAG: hypothetical protein RLZZ292_2367, partial [Bacteroidota bacterium]
MQKYAIPLCGYLKFEYLTEAQYTQHPTMKITILRGFSTLLVLFFAFGYVAQAQNLKAEYDNLNTLPKFINVCGDPEKATVTVSPEGTSLLARQNIKATLNLFPKGVRFVELV